MKNKKIIKLIKKENKIGIFYHIQPDGDSFSSSVGLALALRKKFPKKQINVVGSVKDMPYFGFNKNLPKDLFIKTIDNSFLAIVGDVAVKERIAFFSEYNKAHKKICFDHHKNLINFDADVYWQESKYSASSMQTYEIVKKLKVKLNAEISFNLLIGLLTDTGNFRYSLADNLPVKYFEQLLAHVSNDQMQIFYESLQKRTLEDLKINKEIFNKLQKDNNVIYAVFDKTDKQKYPNFRSQRYINQLANIDKFPIWAMFEFINENGKAFWKAEFRSSKNSVVEVAKKFGGGGHQKACGATFDYNTQIKDVIKELNKIK